MVATSVRKKKLSSRLILRVVVSVAAASRQVAQVMLVEEAVPKITRREAQSSAMMIVVIGSAAVGVAVAPVAPAATAVVTVPLAGAVVRQPQVLATLWAILATLATPMPRAIAKKDRRAVLVVMDKPVKLVKRRVHVTHVIARTIVVQGWATA